MEGFFFAFMPSVVLKEQSNRQSVLCCNYQQPEQLLQCVTYKTKQLLIRDGSLIKHENTSVNTGYTVNIRSFQVISHWFSEGFAPLPNTADY